MRAVNLLPRDVEVVRSGGRTRLVLAAVGGAVAVTVLAGILGMNASGQVDEQRASLELTEAAIARIPVNDRQPVLPDMSAERSNRIAAFQSALSTRTPVDKFMTQLSYVVPADVWLNGLTVTIPSDAAPTTPPAGQAPGQPRRRRRSPSRERRTPSRRSPDSCRGSLLCPRSTRFASPRAVASSRSRIPLSHRAVASPRRSRRRSRRSSSRSPPRPTCGKG